MRPLLLLLAALALCQGGCKRPNGGEPADPKPGQTAATGQTSLAGDWTGTLTVTHSDGIVLPPNLRLSIPAGVHISPAGAVTLDLGAGKSATFEHAGQRLQGNPLSSNFVAADVEKLDVTPTRITLVTRTKSATVSADHRDPLTNESDDRSEMTFTRDGDSMVVTSSRVSLMKGRRTPVVMSGKFTRKGASSGGAGDGTKGGAGAVDPADYYPLKVGHVWRSKSSQGTMDLTAAAEETIGTEKCIRLETSRNGQLVGTEHVVRRADGVYRVAYNGAKTDPPVLILRLPPRAGDRWKMKLQSGAESASGEAVVSEESVTVTAGKFDAVKVRLDLDVNGTKVTSENWYAKGVGVVKHKMKVGTQEITFELEKFEPAR